jgi:hypothetical protein
VQLLHIEFLAAALKARSAVAILLGNRERDAVADILLSS